MKKIGITAALLLASVSTSAVAQDQALVIGTYATDGLSQRLDANGYDVTLIASADLMPSDLSVYTQVWDLRYNNALSANESTYFTNFLSEGGGLFLIGEHSGFASRNNSIVDFIVSAGGGSVTYDGSSTTTQYVTPEFNGNGAVVADPSVGFYIPSAGTYSDSGNGTFFSTTEAGGAGQGIGIAFGTGSLINVPDGRILTYLDVDTFSASMGESTPALRSLVDRMISFVAGSFQVDPELPPPGGEIVVGTIDTSQASFDLGDPEATGTLVTFDGGMLIMTGADPDNTIVVPVLVNETGAFIDTAGGQSEISGDIGGDGGIVLSGGGQIAFSGTNNYAGGTVLTENTTLTITSGNAIGSGNLVLMGGMLQADQALAVSNNVVLMNGANVLDTQTSAVVVDGDISGTGGFTKNGTGTLTLTGANSYTGGTTIAGGTLIGSTASLTGDVVNNAQFVIAQDNDGAFDGDISGTGSFTKNGSGTLTLTGANSYTGGTTIAGGTLIGSTASLTGDVVNNAQFVIAQDNDGAFGGDISGTGGFTKNGSGALTLTGANSYTGGTTIAGGTLIGSTASLTGDVVNNAQFVIAQDNDGAFGGDISGTGGFTKNGSGALTLTGANSYTGGTTIASGTLIGSTASLTGDVVNNAQFVIAQDNDGAFGGDISGTGSFTKNGSGALTLTGANSYTGGTTIAGGTLIGSTASLTGDVVNNAQFVIAQDNDGAFGGDISGTGSFAKNGTGTLTLTGANSYTGNTVVTGGTLIANGFLGNSTVVLQDATRLAGNGLVGGISAGAGSTVAPAGHAIGVLMVDGDITFAAGSTFEVNANAAGEADRIASTGSITLSGGMVQVLAADGNYAPQTAYTILTGASVEGQFDGVETDLAFLMPTLSYADNGVGLVLTRNDVDFADVAATRNQAEVAGAINAAFSADSALYYAVVGQSSQGAQTIFDSLSGEVHASVVNAVVQDSDRTRRAMLGRTNAPRNEGLNLWLQGTGARDEWSNDGNAQGYNRNSAGMLGGLDLLMGDFVVGAALGYTDGEMNVARRMSNASIEGVHAGVYAATTLGPVSLSVGGQYADYDIDTERDLALPGMGQSLSAEYDAETFGAFARAGVRIPLGNGAIEPFAGVNWTRFERGDFAESGGALALTAADETQDWTFSSVGFRTFVPVDRATRFSVSVSGEWQHALGDRETHADLAFAQGDPVFTVAGAPLAEDAALADVALNYRVSDAMSVGVGYSGTIADYGMTNAAKANLSINF